MATSWQQVRDEALRRIQAREWPPGGQIPNEADLAAEWGCARATVNRGLQALADAGWLDRRRRAGTRVAPAPERRAQLAIPLIRQEIEAAGARFSHRILSRRPAPLPPDLCQALDLPAATPAVHVRTLYLAGDTAFALEDRWVNPDAAPGFDAAPLDRIDPNAWLVQNAAFSHGTLDYGAITADAGTAAHLNCPPGSALMVLERMTFGPKAAVTHVRLVYAPGHRLHLRI